MPAAMLHRGLPGEFVPAILLSVCMGCVLAYLRFAPVPGAPVAAVFRPGLGTAGAGARVAGGWRVLGIAAQSPFAVLLLRAADGAAPPTGKPRDVWLLLRADGAAGCDAPSNQRT